MKIQPLESHGLSEMTEHIAGQRNWDESLKNWQEELEIKWQGDLTQQLGRWSPCLLDVMKKQATHHHSSPCKASSYFLSFNEENV